MSLVLRARMMKMLMLVSVYGFSACCQVEADTRTKRVGGLWEYGAT